MSRFSLVPVNLQSLTAAPTTPTLQAGDLYYNSTNSTLNVYNGSAWIGIGGPNGTAGTIAALGAQAAGTSNLYARADHVHPTTGVVLTSTVTAKGDLIAATASGAVTNLPVGANNLVLTADSTQTTGMKWAAVSGAAVDDPITTGFLLGGM